MIFSFREITPIFRREVYRNGQERCKARGRIVKAKLAEFWKRQDEGSLKLARILSTPVASATSLDRRRGSRCWWTPVASFQRSVWLVTNRSERMAKDRNDEVFGGALSEESCSPTREKERQRERESCLHRTIHRVAQFKQRKSIPTNRCNSLEKLLFIPRKHPASFRFRRALHLRHCPVDFSLSILYSRFFLQFPAWRFFQLEQTQIRWVPGKFTCENLFEFIKRFALVSRIKLENLLPGEIHRRLED